MYVIVYSVGGGELFVRPRIAYTTLQRAKAECEYAQEFPGKWLEMEGAYVFVPDDKQAPWPRPEIWEIEIRT